MRAIVQYELPFLLIICCCGVAVRYRDNLDFSKWVAVAISNVLLQLRQSLLCSTTSVAFEPIFQTILSIAKVDIALLHGDDQLFNGDKEGGGEAVPMLFILQTGRVEVLRNDVHMKMVHGLYSMEPVAVLQSGVVIFVVVVHQFVGDALHMA